MRFSCFTSLPPFFLSIHICLAPTTCLHSSSFLPPRNEPATDIFALSRPCFPFPPPLALPSLTCSGLGKSSLKPEDAVSDYSTLTESELKVLDDWEKYFAKRYNIVGVVSE